MIRRKQQRGFSLLELVIVMGIFVIVIFAASQMFVSILFDFKQQGKIAVSNIEGIVGLEMMRRDIEHAGYGLFLSWQSGIPINYIEVAAGNAAGAALNDAPTGVPRPIVIGPDAGHNQSDRLAVKAVNVSANNSSERWTYLYNAPTLSTHSWTPASENIPLSDFVIVTFPVDTVQRYLVTLSTLSTAFTTSYANILSFNNAPGGASFVYSVDPNTAPRMPFNRADFYIASYTTRPATCAQGTGVLYKAVVDHATGNYKPIMPLLDCVADMEVAYRYVGHSDGLADDISQTGPADATTANRIREVRVYILAQEGQKDRNYAYPVQKPRVGDAGGVMGTTGKEFDLGAYITDWQNYRWKLYTLVVKTINL